MKWRYGTVTLIAPVLFLSVLLLTSCGKQAAQEIFDGETLTGWESTDHVFRVRGGAIVGGSLENALEHSYYLCTTSRYENFELTLRAKFNGESALPNAGISFRAERIPGTNHVGGYQADMGYIEPSVIAMFSDYTPPDMVNPYPLWGMLVDEFRPNVSRYREGVAPVLLLDIPERELVENTLKSNDWNAIRIIASGPEIKIFLNDVAIVDYTEAEDWVPRSGIIGLQVHSGGPYEVMYKDISIRELQAD